MASPAIFSVWFNEQLRKGTMTAGEFSQKARIHRATAYFYSAGDRVPKGANLRRVAEAFNIDPTTLPTFAPKAKKD